VRGYFYCQGGEALFVSLEREGYLVPSEEREGKRVLSLMLVLADGEKLRLRIIPIDL
jgi:hypothetical protein